MPPQNVVEIFNYDVFISYKSEQESWALRLAQTLRTLGLRVWRDHDAGNGLRVSENWSESIRNAIRLSRWMIVLWSDRVRSDAASVVHREVQEMNQLLAGDTSGERRFIPILLDDTPFGGYAPLTALHGDTSFKALHDRHGDGGADQVGAFEWYATLKPLIEAMGIKDVTEVRYVVAAMNRSQAEQLRADPDSHAQDAAAFRVMLRVKQATGAPFDPASYGATPDDWRPFPQLDDSFSIRRLIEESDQSRRLHPPGDARWILTSYSAGLASDVSEERSVVQSALQGEPSLVVFDPISLLHRTVLQRFGWLLQDLQAYVIGLSPYVPSMHADLYNDTAEIDEKLYLMLQPAYDAFRLPYDPNPRPRVLNLDHEFQFFRWLQVASEGILAARRSPLRAPRIHPTQIKRIARQKAQAVPGPGIITIGTLGTGPAAPPRGRGLAMKVYLSSSYSDLVEHRRAVADVLRKMGHDVVAMEDHVASDQRPLERCLRDLESSDLVVTIVAWRYGFVPDGGGTRGRSVTELEYDHAREAGKPCLVFLLDEGTDWPMRWVDAISGDGERGERVKAFRELLKQTQVVQFFRTKEDLSSAVAVAVDALIKSAREQPRRDAVALTSVPREKVKETGSVFTFYSFKGGVGRSMALANVGTLLFQQGLTTLLVDWDLEAPGLERYFEDRYRIDPREFAERPGLCDMIAAYKRNAADPAQGDNDDQLPYPPLNDYLYELDRSGNARLLLLSAGRREEGPAWQNYASFVQSLDWAEFYREWEGGAYLEWLRQQFKAVADVVLIDSRTGVTEVSGVVTQHLADVVVLICGANLASLDNTALMARSFGSSAMAEVRNGRKLDVMVVPSRVDDADSRGFLEFVSRLRESFGDLKTPAELHTPEQTLLPYVAALSFKEWLVVGDPTLEETARRLLAAYKLVAGDLQTLARSSSLPTRTADFAWWLVTVPEDVDWGSRILQASEKLPASWLILEPGEASAADTEKLLAEGKPVAVVVSLNSARNGDFLRLARWLLDEGKKLVPVRIDDSPVPLPLSGLWAADVRTDLEKGVADIHRAVVAVSGRPDQPPEGAGKTSGKLVYVSYHHTDAAIAHKVAASLRLAGLRTWLDGENLLPGTFWIEEMERALIAADALVVLVSPRWKTSQHAMMEVNYMVRQEKPLIPVLVHETKPLPLLIAEYQNIDLTEGTDIAVARLGPRVRAALKE